MKINRKRLKKLLKEMTDIYSPSGKEEALLRYLCRYLGEKGYSFIRQAVSENRFNIIIMPMDVSVNTVFVGHIDTVPAYDYNVYEYSEKRGIIKGLGVADMKGGCAAMIEAFTAYIENREKVPNAALALVVGEEESSDGMKRVLEEYDFKKSIIGEPTDMRPCFGHYGYVEVELSLTGFKRHASLSETSKNSTYSMLKVLIDGIEYLDSFGSGMRYNIRDLHSSDSGFAVPEKCSAWLDIHLHPDIKIKSVTRGLKNRIKASLKGFGMKYKDLTIKTDQYKGYKLNPAWNGFKKINKVLNQTYDNKETFYFESHSDANIMKEKNIKPIILGPGRLTEAHTKGEYVRFSQVAKASEIYLNILEELS